MSVVWLCLPPGRMVSAGGNGASYERWIAMAAPKHQFVVDDSGKKKAVILDITEYQKLLEEAEELEGIRAYDAAKAAGDEAIPFEQAVEEIERDRK
jgi:hypothetical protein